MTSFEQALGAPLAFLLLVALSAVVAGTAAAVGGHAGRRGPPSRARPDPLTVGAGVFLGQLAVLVLLAAVGAPPIAAKAAALGLGLAAAYAEKPGAG